MHIVKYAYAALAHMIGMYCLFPAHLHSIMSNVAAGISTPTPASHPPTPTPKREEYIDVIKYIGQDLDQGNILFCLSTANT